eukprot:280296-Rhodomonas_salina.2
MELSAAEGDVVWVWLQAGGLLLVPTNCSCSPEGLCACGKAEEANEGTQPTWAVLVLGDLVLARALD